MSGIEYSLSSLKGGYTGDCRVQGSGSKLLEGGYIGDPFRALKGMCMV